MEKKKISALCMPWSLCFGLDEFWRFWYIFGGFALYLEDIATLCWFDVFGGRFYDALAIGLLHLEEPNVGGSLLWLMHLEALEVFDLAYALEALEVILGG